ncbi:MAG TPA: HEAT repeat domain-containing protein [Pyrinomonadaceae bacterium]|nr:HEAT repeat domain-containing protein [Pyrinomonadaceae bacterium]
MIYLKTRTAARASKVLAGLLLVAGLGLAPAAAQSGELLNRFVQSSGGTDAAARAFQQGRVLIDERKWGAAATHFGRFVAENPSDRNLDAALYWLAYAHEKQNNLREADQSLDRLISEFPRSTWLNDARALKIRVRSRLDPQAVATPKPTDDDLIQIAAMQALCQGDRARCGQVAGEVLGSNRSLVVKESALKLLGRHGGTEAVPALIRLARSEQNERLKMSAISALGQTNDDRVIEVLREIAMSATFDDESPTDSAIHALASLESPRAVPALVDVITNGRNTAARQHAVDLLGRRRGDDVTDALLRVYDSVPDATIRARTVSALGHRKDARAMARLVEVARTAPEAELRKQAIRALPNRGQESDLDVLISLYDSERTPELKTYILDAIGRYNNRRAHQKLMQVARDTREPVERRTRVIQILSRSKDPEILKFLEEMVR